MTIDEWCGWIVSEWSGLPYENAVERYFILMQYINNAMAEHAKESYERGRMDGLEAAAKECSDYAITAMTPEFAYPNGCLNTRVVALCLEKAILTLKQKAQP